MSKIDKSISLLKQYEPPEGYHLAFSGGKDSICILQLAKMSGVKYKAYFYMTTLDPPEVLKFIKTFYPEVIWLRPKTSMFKLIERKGLPIRSKRFCCEVLKENHAENETVITGIRHDESKKRKDLPYYSEKKNKKLLHPIADWTSADVWKFIHEHKLMFPEVYLSCRNRIGCIACPMNPKHAMEDLEKYPRFKYAFLKAIRKAKARGIMKVFESAEEALDWWVSGDSIKAFRAKKNQTELFK